MGKVKVLITKNITISTWKVNCRVSSLVTTCSQTFFSNFSKCERRKKNIREALLGGFLMPPVWVSNLFPSKFQKVCMLLPLIYLGKNLERKHTWRDLVQYRNCQLNQNMHGKCILSHIVRWKFILKSRFSHALLNMCVTRSTKGGEHTWQSLPCHIKNLFEQQKAFSFQIEARLNQKKMIVQKMNVCIIRQKRMRIKRNQKNHGKLGCEITHGCAMKRRQCSAIFVGNLTPLHWKREYKV